MERGGKAPEIVPAPGETIAPEILAHQIADIAKAAKRMAACGLKREAVVILIHDRSKVSRKAINLVMDNLEHLAETWLTDEARKRLKA